MWLFMNKDVVNANGHLRDATFRSQSGIKSSRVIFWNVIFGGLTKNFRNSLKRVI